MLIVLFVISILIFIISLEISKRNCAKLPFIAAFLSAMCGAICLTIIVMLSSKINSIESVNEKIEICIRENAKIETDGLAKQKIAIYVDNNKRIQELKEEMIAAEAAKWWLYFGEEKMDGNY